MNRDNVICIYVTQTQNLHWSENVIGNEGVESNRLPFLCHVVSCSIKNMHEKIQTLPNAEIRILHCFYIAWQIVTYLHDKQLYTTVTHTKLHESQIRQNTH